MAGAADGRIIIDVLLNSDDLDSQVTKTENHVKSKFGRMADSVGSFGKAIGIATAAIIALGVATIALVKPFVEATGAARALQAQFETVFSGLEKEAVKSLNNIANETGILPDRLKGSFVQIAAFGKTAGFDTAEALSLTSRATLAAADSAAFYDRSIESVTESLQSFLKGNYANDAALGIAATETTRNAAANKLYGKSFKDLSEAQKQLTLLQMVEDGNKLAGALGQAARETDGFENVLGNFKQGWQNLKIQLGEFIFDDVINGMKKLTVIMMNLDLTKAKEQFEAFLTTLKKVGSIGVDAIKRLYNYLKPTFDEIGAVFTAISNVVVDASKSMYNAIVTNWDNIVYYTKSALDTVFNLNKMVFGAILEFYKNAFLALQNFWKNHGDTVINYVTQYLQTVYNFFETMFTNIYTVVSDILNTLSTFWQNHGDIIMAVVMYAYDYIYKNIEAAVIAVYEFIAEQLNKIKDFWAENGEQIVEAVKNYYTVILVILGVLFAEISAILAVAIPIIINAIKYLWDVVTGVLSGAIDIMLGMIQIFTGIFTLDLQQLWEGIKKIFSGAISIVINLLKLNFISVIISTIASLVMAVINKIKEMWNAVVSACSNAIYSVISYFANLYSNITSSISNAAANVARSVKGMAKDMLDAVKGLPGDFLQVGKDIGQGIIDGIKKLNPVNAIKNIAGDMLSGAKGILGIKSPSTRFRKEVAHETMNGWMLGLEDKADEAQRTLIDAMGVADVNALDLMGNYNGSLGGNYNIGLGGLVQPTQVASNSHSSSVVTNNNGNSTSITVYGNTDVAELERVQRKLQFGF